MNDHLIPRILTISEAAQLSKELSIGISKNYIRTLVKSGSIKFHMAGTKTLIVWDSLLEYLNNPPDYHKKPVTTGIRPVPERLIG